MARLASGVRKRSDGKLEKRITIDGKRYSVYGLTSKEINEKEQNLRKQIENKKYQVNKNLILDKYFEEWVIAKRKTVKSNTLNLYTQIYKTHISSVFGKKKVQKIERREVSYFQNQLSEQLSESTRNFILLVLNMILNDAVRDEVIERNPAKNIKPLKDTKEKASETIHRALTHEEQNSFMDAVKNEYYYEFFAFLLCTGMRFGEASALSWEDIDYKNNVIHVAKTVTATEDGKRIIGDSPKTDSGKRDIPMNETIKQVLSMQRSKYGNVLQFSKGTIFCSVSGGLIHNTTINATIKRILSNLEKQNVHIEPFTVHALRDTFATRFIEQGGNPQTLKTILGHASLSMTMDLYAHVLPNTKQQEMNNLIIAV